MGDSGPSQKAINTGAIIVGVVGGVIILCLLLILLCLLYKKEKEKKEQHLKSRRASYLQPDAEPGMPPQQPLDGPPGSPPPFAAFDSTRRREGAPWQWPSLRQREGDDDGGGGYGKGGNPRQALLSPVLTGVGDIPSRPRSSCPNLNAISPTSSFKAGSGPTFQDAANGGYDRPSRTSSNRLGASARRPGDYAYGGQYHGSGGDDFSPPSGIPAGRRHASATSLPYDPRLAGAAGTPDGFMRSESWAAPRPSSANRPLSTPPSSGSRGAQMAGQQPAWRAGMASTTSPIIAGNSSRWRPSRLGRQTPAVADPDGSGLDNGGAPGGRSGSPGMQHQRSRTVTGLAHSEAELARPDGPPAQGFASLAGRSGSLSAQPHARSSRLIATSSDDDDDDRGADMDSDDDRFDDDGLDGLGGLSGAPHSMELLSTTDGAAGHLRGGHQMLATGAVDPVFTIGGSFISGLPPSSSGYFFVMGGGGSGHGSGLRSEPALDGRGSGGGAGAGGAAERKSRWSLLGRRESKIVDGGGGEGSRSGSVTMVSNPMYRTSSHPAPLPTQRDEPEITALLPPRRMSRFGGGSTTAVGAHPWLLPPDDLDPRSAASSPGMRRPAATHAGFSQPAPVAHAPGPGPSSGSGPYAAAALRSPGVLRREIDSASPRRSTLAGHMVQGSGSGRADGPASSGRRRTLHNFDESLGPDGLQRQRSTRPTYAQAHLAADMRPQPSIEALMATERSLPGSPRRASLLLPDSAFATTHLIREADFRDAR